jgi:hypothetical protein
MATVFNRAWAMPSADTFSIPPIKEFVERWLDGAAVVVDPFARNCRYGTIRNDLNPDTDAEYHMEAVDFCRVLAVRGVVADAVIFDPQYSPTQMKTVYQSVGLDKGSRTGQNARLYKEVRDELDAILAPSGIALSFGWNSVGFGKGRGYELLEQLNVCHGGAHNDTICIAERRRATPTEVSE